MSTTQVSVDTVGGQVICCMKNCICVRVQDFLSTAEMSHDQPRLLAALKMSSAAIAKVRMVYCYKDTVYTNWSTNTITVKTE